MCRCTALKKHMIIDGGFDQQSQRIVRKPSEGVEKWSLTYHIITETLMQKICPSDPSYTLFSHYQCCSTFLDIFEKALARTQHWEIKIWRVWIVLETMTDNSLSGKSQKPKVIFDGYTFFPVPVWKSYLHQRQINYSKQRCIMFYIWN